MHDLGVGQALLLGILQGLTEFLPISSSGHLVVAQQWFGLALPATTLAAFDVALHAGTLCAVLVYYRRDLWPMLVGRNWRLVGLLVAGTIPAAVLGIPGRGQIEALFTSVAVVGVAWLVTGTYLWGTHYVRPRTFATVRVGRALTIGIAQAVALIPGISRSGATIATGMFLRLPPAEAARYAFLLAIPAIGGGLLFEVPHLRHLGPEFALPLAVGVGSSALVGYLAIHWLLRSIARGGLRWFGVYCWVAGGLALLMS